MTVKKLWYKNRLYKVVEVISQRKRQKGIWMQRGSL